VAPSTPLTLSNPGSNPHPYPKETLDPSSNPNFVTLALTLTL